MTRICQNLNHHSVRRINAIIPNFSAHNLFLWQIVYYCPDKKYCKKYCILWTKKYCNTTIRKVYWNQWRIQKVLLGGGGKWRRLYRRRWRWGRTPKTREDRSAKDAERGFGVLRKCSPPHWRGGWRGGYAPSPENFSIVKLKKRVFMHSGVARPLKSRFYDPGCVSIFFDSKPSGGGGNRPLRPLVVRPWLQYYCNTEKYSNAVVSDFRTPKCQARVTDSAFADHCSRLQITCTVVLTIIS